MAFVATSPSAKQANNMWMILAKVRIRVPRQPPVLTTYIVENYPQLRFVAVWGANVRAMVGALRNERRFAAGMRPARADR